MARVVVLASGGMDSAVLLALSRGQAHESTILFFDYGQRALEQELFHVKQLKDWYDVQYLEMICLRDVFGQQGLTDEMADLKGDPSKEKRSRAEVSFRNGVFAAIGTAVADRLHCDEVWIGTHKGRSQSGLDSLYPDSTPAFINSMGVAVVAGTNSRVSLVAPLMHLFKEEIVAKGESHGVPWTLTYSCYEGTDPACGVCMACVDRERALKRSRAWQSLP